MDKFLEAWMDATAWFVVGDPRSDQTWTEEDEEVAEVLDVLL